MRRVSPSLSPLFSNPIQSNAGRSCRSLGTTEKRGRRTEHGKRQEGRKPADLVRLPPSHPPPRRVAAAINTRKPLRLQGCFLNAGESPQVSWNLRQREFTDETFSESRLIPGLFFCSPRNRRRIKGLARTGPGHRGPLCWCSVREGKNGGRRKRECPTPRPQLNRGRNRAPLSSLLSFSGRASVSS